MRKIRQVLRLSWETNFSGRQIAQSIGISRESVADYLTRATAAGLRWPLPPELDDEKLEERLFPPVISASRRPEPDWETVHTDLQRKGGTLAALHAEFLVAHPDGIAYSLFCERYRAWQKGLKRYMRQPHVAGDRIFVDYAGPTIKIFDPATKELRPAQLFVGILGASNYTFAEAHWSQRLSDWISAHVRMFEFFGGCPNVVVCDNLKSAVTKASRTEPQVHPTYQNLAEHYGTVILPARPHKPKDKSKVEGAVLIVERWILFRLRNRVFTTLEDANDAIRALLTDLNNRPFQKRPGTRSSHFCELDQPALKQLPEQAFEYIEFHRVRIGFDGRFSFAGTPYSVPERLSGLEVDLRITAAVIEILFKGRRLASHKRQDNSEPQIDTQHLSPANRAFGQWTPDADLQWANSIGPNTHAFLCKLIGDNKIKEFGYRSGLSMKRLAKLYPSERLEAACNRAEVIGAATIASIKSILRTGLDKQMTSQDDKQEADFDHVNVRGSDYYH